MKKQQTGNKDAKLELWDMSYYQDKYKKKFFNVDEELIRDYLPSEHVKSATLEIYQQLLGLEFTLIPGAETWEQSVSLYEVKDAKTKEVRGHFYLDLYPRPNKFNHAACMGIVPKTTIGGLS